ncbi:MAG: P83/100 family protein [Spirochaetaceae bacterium]|nr:P83/100 family protein [Spirochaetaceae bacterium]
MSRFAATALCFLALSAPALLALDVDRSELESAKDGDIVFVSYEGPQPKIDSLSSIKGLGAALGKEIAGGASRAGTDARYSVIRIVDPSVPTGLDADVLRLGKAVQVDHIRNLRWIVAGYLGAAWGYKESDAFILATFVTVYNAVNRGKMDYFASRYKSGVLAELKAEEAGLALTYLEWPGKTQIVIPLSSGAKPGDLGAVDTTAISEPEVKESLREQPDMGISDRQALVDIKEREAEQKQAELDKKKEELAAAEKKVAEDKAKAEAARAKLEADKATAAAAAATAAKPTPAVSSTAEKPAEAAAKPPVAPAEAPAAAKPTEPIGAVAAPPVDEQIAKREEEVAAAEAKVAAREEEIAAEKEKVAVAEEKVEAKREEAAADRQEITSDQKEQIAEEVAVGKSAEDAGVYLLRIVDDKERLAQVVFLDAEKGGLIRSSRINSIHIRSIEETEESFFAVAGAEDKSGGVKVVKLEKASLESAAEGESDMFPESVLLVSGDRIYGVARDVDAAAGGEQSYFVVLLDGELGEIARSTSAVTPWTFLKEGGGGILVQLPEGGFAILAADSLETERELDL